MIYLNSIEELGMYIRNGVMIFFGCIGGFIVLWLVIKLIKFILYIRRGRRIRKVEKELKKLK